MADHTARLIAVVLLLIAALGSMITGYWLAALAWFFLAGFAGRPFVSGCKVDLNYEGGAELAGGRRATGETFAGAPVVSC